MEPKLRKAAFVEHCAQIRLECLVWFVPGSFSLAWFLLLVYRRAPYKLSVFIFWDAGASASTTSSRL